MYRRDLATGGFEIVSIGLHGRPADGDSSAVGISADARFALFSSTAHNLTRQPPTVVPQLYVRDMQTGRMHWASEGPDGESSGRISGSNAYLSRSGRFVIFAASFGSACGQYGVYAHDLRRDTTRLVSRTSGGAPLCVPKTPDCQRGGPNGVPFDSPMISNDGRVIAFHQLFAGLRHPCYNAEVAVSDVGSRFAKVVDYGSSWSNPSNDGSALQWLSPDGRYIAVDRNEPRIVDLRNHRTWHIDGSGAQTEPMVINATGRIVFWGDTSNDEVPDCLSTRRTARPRGVLASTLWTVIRLSRAYRVSSGSRTMAATSPLCPWTGIST